MWARRGAARPRVPAREPLRLPGRADGPARHRRGPGRGRLGVRSPRLYAVSGAPARDHDTSVEHASPHTISRERYKGVLDERSSGCSGAGLPFAPARRRSNPPRPTTISSSPRRRSSTRTRAHHRGRRRAGPARGDDRAARRRPALLPALRGIAAALGRRILIQGFAGTWRIGSRCLRSWRPCAPISREVLGDVRPRRTLRGGHPRPLPNPRNHRALPGSARVAEATTPCAGTGSRSTCGSGATWWRRWVRGLGLRHLSGLGLGHDHARGGEDAGGDPEALREFQRLVTGQGTCEGEGMGDLPSWWGEQVSHPGQMRHPGLACRARRPGARDGAVPRNEEIEPWWAEKKSPCGATWRRWSSPPGTASSFPRA